MSSSVEKLCSIRSAMLSNFVDSLLISSIVVSIRVMVFTLLLRSVFKFGYWHVAVGSSMLLCFRCIFCSVDNVCSRLLFCLYVSVIGIRGRDREERDKERGRESVLEVSSRRRDVRFLYLRFDEAPRPSEYGTCCGLGCFLLAISDHVVGAAVFVCRFAVIAGASGGVLLVLLGPSWLAGAKLSVDFIFCTIPT